MKKELSYWTDGRAWLWALLFIVEFSLIVLPFMAAFTTPVTALVLLLGVAWISFVGAMYVT